MRKKLQLEIEGGKYEDVTIELTGNSMKLFRILDAIPSVIIVSDFDVSHGSRRLIVKYFKLSIIHLHFICDSKKSRDDIAYNIISVLSNEASLSISRKNSQWHYSEELLVIKISEE